MTDEDTAAVVAEVTEDSLSLSDVFNDSEVKESEVTETVAAETKTDDDQGDTTVTETEAKAEEAVTKEAEPPSVEQGQLAALMAERDRRQSAEARVKELESKVEPEALIDPIEDPEGYKAKLESDRTSSELRTRISISKTMMTELDPDYLRLEGVFMGLVADAEGNITDQGLLTKFQQSDNPAKMARDHAKQHEHVLAMSDPKYTENLEATIRAKVLAEIEEQSKAGLSAVDVPDLTKATASMSNSVQVIKSSELGDIFEDSPL